MSSILAQRVEQPGGEFTSAAAKTREVDAGLPIIRKLAAVYLNLLDRPQPLRSIPLTALGMPDLSPPPERHGGVESCDGNARLNSTGRQSS